MVNLSTDLHGLRTGVSVIENDQSQALKEMTLPRDARDVRSFSVETVFNYFAHFGVDWLTADRVLEGNLQDGNLTLAERTWHPGKTNE